MQCNHRRPLVVPLLLAIASLGACVLDHDAIEGAPDPQRIGARPPPRVAVGGTLSYRDLLDDPAGSDEVRARGGLLYMHNSGWGALRVEERQAVTAMFDGPRLVEISASGDNAADWMRVVQTRFLDIGARPDLALVNSLGVATDDDQTDAYVATMRAAGIGRVIPVYGPNSGQWQDGHFVSSPGFAGLRHAIIAGGGVATDAPPAFYYRQPSGYRNFVIDMIKWTNGINRTSVVILSPNQSGDQFLEDTQRFVAELERRRAVPTYYVVQNYLPTDVDPGAGYVNRIGREDDEDSVLAVAAWLQRHLAGEE